MTYIFLPSCLLAIKEYNIAMTQCSSTFFDIRIAPVWRWGGFNLEYGYEFEKSLNISAVQGRRKLSGRNQNWRWTPKDSAKTPNVICYQRIFMDWRNSIQWNPKVDKQRSFFQFYWMVWTRKLHLQRTNVSLHWIGKQPHFVH